MENLKAAVHGTFYPHGPAWIICCLVVMEIAPRMQLQLFDPTRDINTLQQEELTVYQTWAIF